ncbi:MAG: IS630 family transposase [Planctomycetota bacterium]|nr:IS630 family transposase [Planctomycetota bacterium]
MRPHGSAKTLEQRRRRAMRLLDSGLTMEEVSHRVGTSIASVWRWRQSVAEGGLAALAAKPVPGRPRKLQKDECQKLLDLLLKGAMAYGYPNELWTLKRIARVIRREFGVRYHPNHVWRVLRQLRWSCQVPERRPVQRDEQAIEHWKRYRWPHTKKGARTWGPSGLP